MIEEPEKDKKINVEWSQELQDNLKKDIEKLNNDLEEILQIT